MHEDAQLHRDTDHACPKGEAHVAFDPWLRAGAISEADEHDYRQDCQDRLEQSAEHRWNWEVIGSHVRLVAPELEAGHASTPAGYAGS